MNQAINEMPVTKEEDDETYYFDGGQVAVEVGDRVEVSREVFSAIPHSVAGHFNEGGI